MTGTARRVSAQRPLDDTIDRPIDDVRGLVPDHQEAESRPLPPPDSPPPGPRGPRRISRPLIIGLALLAAAAIAAAAIVVLHPFGHHHSPPVPPASTSSAPVSTSPSPVVTSSAPSPTPASRQQAASDLAALLSQSVSERNAVDNAFSDVMQCGPSLNQDAQTFDNAAASRQRLLSQLAADPSRSALPQPMLQDLTNAWQASVAADKDFAAWARDQASGGCVPNQPDPHFQAAASPDRRATAAKKAFLRRWNPLAAQYGLTTYQQGEL